MKYWQGMTLTVAFLAALTAIGCGPSGGTTQLAPSSGPETDPYQAPGADPNPDAKN